MNFAKSLSGLIGSQCNGLSLAVLIFVSMFSSQLAKADQSNFCADLFQQDQQLTEDDLYVNEILVPMAKAGQIEPLFERIKNLIYWMAGKYSHVMDKRDLFQSGYLGFHKAVERWDPKYNETTRFVSFAAVYIRERIYYQLRRNNLASSAGLGYRLGRIRSGEETVDSVVPDLVNWKGLYTPIQDDSYALIDVIPVHDNPEDYLHFRYALKTIFETVEAIHKSGRLNDTQYNIFVEYYFNGITIHGTADRLKLSRAHVGRILPVTKNIVYRALPEELRDDYRMLTDLIETSN